MSSEKNQSLQDVFLNYIRKNRVPVTVFLVNGVKLQGVVSWFDNFSLLLRRDALSQLVYKHAISTVMPAVPVHLFDPGQNNGDSERDDGDAGTGMVNAGSDGEVPSGVEVIYQGGRPAHGSGRSGTGQHGPHTLRIGGVVSR